jgi:PBP1b-binding outer membrane lipoprotein LpoB
MIMKKIYLIILITGLVIYGCTDKFDDYNEDDKNPPEVPGESLFSNAQKELCDQITIPEVNRNISTSGHSTGRKRLIRMKPIMTSSPGIFRIMYSVFITGNRSRTWMKPTG